MSESARVGRIRRARAVELVVEELARAIGQGAYAPGEKLPSEPGLCRLLGVGRNTVREALKQLEVLGAVTIRHGEGTFVCRPEDPLLSRALRSVVLVGGISVDELVEARLAVELEATRLAAVRGTAEHHRAIRAVLQEMQAAVDAPDRFSELDRRYHYAVAVASGNRLFPRFLESIRDVLQDQQMRISEDRSLRVSVLRYHQEIAEAISQRDAQRAVALMNEHLSNIRLRLAHP